MFSANRAFVSGARYFSSAQPKTGIVMFNMGGPSTTPEVEPFLNRLFSDPEIIPLPFQKWTSPLLVKRRLSRVTADYEQIGGSPIRKWTELQGRGMCERLDKLRPESAPHKFYVAFRYADPLTEECLVQMKADGIERAVGFSQYPQFSCTTAGSSFNHMWRVAKQMGLADTFKWSVIDRWYSHPGYIASVVDTIERGLSKYDAAVRDKVCIVFSAHSLPIRTVAKGDQYPPEISATAAMVMQQLKNGPNKRPNAYIMAWQSQVGPLPWLGPQTGEVLKGLGAQGFKHVMSVPLGFTSDHIETLYEVDHTYAEMAKDAGIEHFSRAPSLNDSPVLMDAMAAIVSQHLDSGRAAETPQYALNCPTCTNPDCRSILNPIAPFSNQRTANGKAL